MAIIPGESLEALTCGLPQRASIWFNTSLSGSRVFFGNSGVISRTRKNRALGGGAALRCCVRTERARVAKTGHHLGHFLAHCPLAFVGGPGDAHLPKTAKSSESLRLPQPQLCRLMAGAQAGPGCATSLTSKASPSRHAGPNRFAATAGGAPVTDLKCKLAAAHRAAVCTGSAPKGG